MFHREQLEERERQTLAPFALLSGESRGRRHPETDDPIRTMYQRDRDRVIHSTAFRRLEYKTQVFVYHEGDHYRTRLTHSIEVSQIARSIANALGLNETFVESLALAHDIGHPPFGHSGGEVLHQRMIDRDGFEHNVQGLRIVDSLEKRYADFPGLNLSFELREAILKHGPTGPDARTPEFTPMRPPALETRVVDLADSTAYNHHDLDDGLRSGILDLEDLCNKVPLVGECHAAAVKKSGATDPKMLHLLTVNAVVKRSIADLTRVTGEHLSASDIRSADEARNDSSLVSFSDEMQKAQRELQDYLFANFYRHHRVVRMMDKAKRMIESLFDIYVDRPQLLPPEFQIWAETEGVHRAACDYIAGMTDRFAEQDYRRLFDPTEHA